MEMLKGSIAICTKDRPQLLRRALQNLAAQQWPADWSILVVDNSESGSARPVFDDLVGSLPSHSRYVLDSRPGFSSVRNRAVKECEGCEAVVFFDDDMVARSGWVATMAQHAADHPGAIVHSKVARVVEVPQTQAEIDALSDELLGEGNVAPEGTNGLLVPLAAATQHPFDAKLDKSGSEDTDLLIRLRKAGIPRVVPEDALAMEQDRLLVAPLWSAVRAYIRVGRVYMAVKKSNELPTGLQRFLSVGGTATAGAAAATAALAGKRVRARQLVRVSATRWGVVLGPRLLDRGR